MSGFNSAADDQRQAFAGIIGSQLGTSLQQLLLSDEIVPGHAPSYELCKTIYLFHPLGAKMAEQPIRMAQSQERIINVGDAPEDRVRDQFVEEWVKFGTDTRILDVMAQSRVYGIASLALGEVGKDPAKPLDLQALAKEEVYINVYDPLLTAGSLVLSQQPLDPAFLKTADIRVQGQTFHRSRTCVVMHERPIFLAYTAGGYGYVGRSVYQRALFPLKSYIQTMIADDMVSKKAGLIVAKIKQAGGVVTALMQKLAGIKRQLLVQGLTNQVLGITPDESIESLNLQNIDKSLETARKHILENIATAAPMPAKLITQETFAEGFGEGTEDAKAVARYLNEVRVQMTPVYRFMDRVVQRRAWTEEFYKTIQKDYPEYKKCSFEEAFYRWERSFSSKWPSLLEEPESDRIRIDETKFKTIIAYLEVMLPLCDPENKATLLAWAADNINTNKQLITTPLELDWEALATYEPPMEEGGEGGASGGKSPFGGKGPRAAGPQRLPSDTTKLPKPPTPYSAASRGLRWRGGG